VGKVRPHIHTVLQYGIFILSLIYFVILTCWMPISLREHYTYGEGTPQKILVKTGQTGSEVAWMIFEEGLVNNPKDLIFWMLKLKVDRSIKPGIYIIKPGTPWEIAKQLEITKPITEKVTLYPGENLKELQAYFKTNYGEDFLNELKKNENFPSNIRDKLPERVESRIAFLLPDTYYVIPEEGYSSQVIKAASNAWYNTVGRALGESYLNKDYLLKVATVASLVEKEAAKEGEKKIIAGVIYNRLNKGMPLQVDATVIFAWNKRGIKLNRVLYKHLKIRSPYNTYLFKGLPPGPICVPSIKSWIAAIQPGKHSYLYYVAQKNGSHIFSKSYEEHLKAIEKRNKERKTEGNK